MTTVSSVFLLLLALPAFAQDPPKPKAEPQKLSTQEKIRSSLTLCVKVGAEPEGRKICAKALGTAKELAKKKNLAAQEKAIGQVEEFMASLDSSSGTKTAAQLEADFNAIAKSLPVRSFKPSYARYFPPPAPPPGSGQTAAAAKGAAGGPEAKGKLTPAQAKAMQDATGIAGALNQDKQAGSLPTSTKPAPPFKTYSFSPPDPDQIKTAKNSTKNYNMPEILSEVPQMWASYGPMFKKVGANLNVDPYALAAFCVFESYSNVKHNFNPGMRDPPPKKCRGDAECERRDRIIGAGIAATQVKDVKGTVIPGLKERFPASHDETAALLRANPEYSARAVASEFKENYEKHQDLAKVFPKVALPGWPAGGSPGNYGTKPEYVSRAYVLYQAFRAAEEKGSLPATQFATKDAGKN